MPDRHAHARTLFAPLGPSYDRVGAALSFGQDPRWRRAMVAHIPRDGGTVLDVATGTGLVAAAAARRAVTPSSGSTRAPTCSPSRGDGSATASSSSRRPRRRSRSPTRRSTTSRSRTSSATSTTPPRRSPSSRASCARAARSPCSSSASRAGSGGRSGICTSASGSRSPGGSISPGWYEVGRFLGPSIRGFYGRWPLERQLELWQRGRDRRASAPGD